MQSQKLLCISKPMVERLTELTEDHPHGEEITALRQLANDAMRTSPHARSFVEDLEAQQLLLAGDSAGALQKWGEATGRYSVDKLIFGLTESLWSIRLDRAKVAASFGDHPTAREILATFDNMAGFVDQVAWPAMLRTRVLAEAAAGNLPAAQEAFDQLMDVVLKEPDGRGVSLRDELVAELSPLISSGTNN